MISLLYEEGGYRESIKIRIQEMIEFVSIDKLQNIVKEVLTEESITTNQYSMMNIVLHYAISIVRIQQGNTLIETQKHSSENTPKNTKYRKKLLKFSRKNTKSIFQRQRQNNSDFYMLACKMNNLLMPIMANWTNLSIKKSSKHLKACSPMWKKPISSISKMSNFLSS